MLNEDQTAIVKSTVPLLEMGGEALTTHFYKIMLAEHDEVRPLFNQAHQASGTQQRALANAVLLYARHIDNLGGLGNLPAQIIQKHVALQVLPEHYPIVGACLLRAIREVLGEEIATDAVIAAWAAAYQQLADILIGAEGAEYDRLEAMPGGWRGGRQVRVARKVQESAEITSFHLEPVGGEAVVDYVPGQYLGLSLVIDGEEVRRNYSLSQAPNGRSYRISVKREPSGLVSNYLHQSVGVGDVLNVFPPAGDFTLKPNTTPLVLISGGVGITPTLAMAEAALAEGQRDVIFIHYARNGDVHAFGETIDGWAVNHPQFKAHIVYEQGTPSDGGWPTMIGRPELAHLEQWLPESRNYDSYLLGPKPFMAFVRKSLLSLGLPEANVHCEFFGPAEALD